MPRSYRHVKDYEIEILELKAQVLSKKRDWKTVRFHNNTMVVYYSIELKNKTGYI